MIYYISKPASHKLDKSIIKGIMEVDPKAVFCKNLNEADICVFQKNWTKSRICVAEHHLARDKHIKREEAYIYTDKYTAKLNSIKKR